MQHSPTLVLDATSNRTSDLKCPNCGGSHLHHIKVAVYDRSEDAAQVTKTVVANGRASMDKVDSLSSGNPSTRRDGIVVSFECETCPAGKDGPLELTIAQHKGSTEIGWRFDL
ncbi:hypothetical protein [Sinorhizobium meliloti]|uniref:hypothetical protein n=1 Tax=Rhizobium meliloti TaxID=382 RepID=UPI00048189F9|nr:hypothetical protein [Sinorhizobium meliloti]MDE4619650.1 hypothetical protein [Sinorhizobium meliloti]